MKLQQTRATIVMEWHPSEGRRPVQHWQELGACIGHCIMLILTSVMESGPGWHPMSGTGPTDSWASEGAWALCGTRRVRVISGAGARIRNFIVSVVPSSQQGPLASSESPVNNSAFVCRPPAWWHTRPLVRIECTLECQCYLRDVKWKKCAGRDYLALVSSADKMSAESDSGCAGLCTAAAWPSAVCTLRLKLGAAIFWAQDFTD